VNETLHRATDKPSSCHLLPESTSSELHLNDRSIPAQLMEFFGVFDGRVERLAKCAMFNRQSQIEKSARSISLVVRS